MNLFRYREQFISLKKFIQIFKKILFIMIQILSHETVIM